MRSDISYKKIIFVKYIKPLNFAIGTGEYLDEIIKIVKKEIIQDDIECDIKVLKSDKLLFSICVDLVVNPD